MNELHLFLEKLAASYTDKSFVKITLSKPAYKSDGLLNVYIRLVTIKSELVFSFTYHYQTNDQVKKVGKEWGINQAKELKDNNVPVIHFYYPYDLFLEQNLLF